MVNRNIHAEIYALEEMGYSVSRNRAYDEITVHDVELPSGYQPNTIDVIFHLPPNYPFSPPSISTNTDLKFNSKTPGILEQTSPYDDLGRLNVIVENPKETTLSGYLRELLWDLEPPRQIAATTR